MTKRQPTATTISPAVTAISYVRDIENRLLDRYRAVLERNDPQAARLLARKTQLQGSASTTASGRLKNRRLRDYLAFWNDLDSQQQWKLSAQDARINQLARLASTIGTTAIVQAHNSIKATTAGSFDYVLRRCRAEGVLASQLQTYIDENAVAWFSLTGHPTNPTTVAYTAAQINVAKVLADPAASGAALDEALQALYDAPIVGDRKTPLQEAEETLATLDVIYDTALEHKRFFEKSLADHGYAAEGVKITTPLIMPCAWTLGDGDGNENLTAAVLKDGIALHRRRIAARYRDTLDQIGLKPGKTFDALYASLQTLSETPTGAVDNAALLIGQIEGLARETKNEAGRDLHDLAYLVRCFGLGFATIDIRHNAVEIMDTAHRLGQLCGLGSMEDFAALNLDQAAMRLTEWLQDDVLLQKFSALSPAQFEQAQDDAASRIFGRLKVIGDNPDMCDKLIIAETTHPAQALAALLLLKVTGNIVGAAGSRIDLTILSESVKDLMGLGNMLESLLDNDTFRNHVVSRKRLLVMIAKSDTTRQDGRGEAEYAQYETAVDIYRVTDKMRRKYPALDCVKTSIKNGGGHALQRGGGRVTEIAAVHGHAAADARVTDCGPSTLTIQGEQLTILFCPGKVALGSLEAFVAQNLYTKAGIRGELPMPRFARGINKQYARADAWLYAATAGRAFDRFTKQSDAIDNLLVHAPWLAMKAGNASSRPGKRGEKMVGPGITPAEAKGNDPRALQGRAISGERLTAHACLPIFSVLGLLEAMEAVRDQSAANANPHKYGDPLHHLYRAHKLHRDGARVTINAVRMADFDIAWPLLTGRIKPAMLEIQTLAQNFDAGNASAEATLAWLEQYFLNVEKRSYEMVSGQPAGRGFKPGDALKKLWPDLAEEVSHRDRGAEFARVIECTRTRQFDRHADTPLSELDFRITQALYTAANVVNAPVGILATRTRLEPVYEFKAGKRTRFMKPESFDEYDVHKLLKIPAALQ